MKVSMNILSKFVLLIFIPLFGMQLTEEQKSFASAHFNLSVPEGLLLPYSIFFDDFDSLSLRLLDQIKVQEMKREVDADVFHVGMTCGIGVIPCATEILCPEFRIPIYAASGYLLKKIFDFHSSDEVIINAQIKLQRDWLNHLKGLRELWLSQTYHEV
jgi:hypothetical protein